MIGTKVCFWWAMAAAITGGLPMTVSVFWISKGWPENSISEGEWFQLSCAKRRFSDIQMGELIMKRRRSNSYCGDAGMIHFVFDVLIPFWIIKADTQKMYA